MWARRAARTAARPSGSPVRGARRQPGWRFNRIFLAPKPARISARKLAEVPFEKETCILYVPRSRVQGLVLVSSGFEFVYVSAYTNGNLTANETKPRTRV